MSTSFSLNFCGYAIFPVVPGDLNLLKSVCNLLITFWPFLWDIAIWCRVIAGQLVLLPVQTRDRSDLCYRLACWKLTYFLRKGTLCVCKCLTCGCWHSGQQAFVRTAWLQTHCMTDCCITSWSRQESTQCCSEVTVKTQVTNWWEVKGNYDWNSGYTWNLI